MEEFLQKWADERLARTQSALTKEATIYEVEQGLVAFQTLLEYHTDIAFDFFEAWCLRNIFIIPPDLPVVLPHQKGLDLTLTVEKEQELVDEVEQLRKRLDSVRSISLPSLLSWVSTRLTRFFLATKTKSSTITILTHCNAAA